MTYVQIITHNIVDIVGALFMVFFAIEAVVKIGAYTVREIHRALKESHEL